MSGECEVQDKMKYHKTDGWKEVQKRQVGIYKQAGRGFNGDATDRRTPPTAVQCHSSSMTAGKRSPALYKLGGKDNIGIKMEGNMLEVEQKQRKGRKKSSVKENRSYHFLFMPFDDRL